MRPLDVVYACHPLVTHWVVTPLGSLSDPQSCLVLLGHNSFQVYYQVLNMHLLQVLKRRNEKYINKYMFLLSLG